MLTSAVLLIDLGGRTQGSTYDYLDVRGNVTLAGTLSLRFVNGFEGSILSTDTFTILNAGVSGGLTGAFANVLSGQRLVTSDGLGSFEVNYGLDGVTLSNFQAVPEPETYVLLGIGFAAVVAITRRRRRRE